MISVEIDDSLPMCNDSFSLTEHSVSDLSD